MRYQGKVTRWKDEQGFGFITPNGGGEPGFLHIKAVAMRGRRPLDGEIVTYELAIDPKGRGRAENVALVDASSLFGTPVRGRTGSGGLPMVVVPFFAFLLVCTLAGRLPMTILGLYAGASVLAFAIYAWDKSAAENGRWRTPEKTLHMIGLCGGWPGALVAQRVLRHKSKKASFQVGFWVTVLLNCGVLGWLLMAKGSGLLLSALAGVV